MIMLWSIFTIHTSHIKAKTWILNTISINCIEASMMKLNFTLIASLVAIASAIQIQPRIVNGIASESKRFPYFVNVIQNLTTNGFMCGGSLISDKYSI